MKYILYFKYICKPLAENLDEGGFLCWTVSVGIFLYIFLLSSDPDLKFTGFD